MEVAVSALRAELKHWIDHVRAGQDVIVTERGVPVARLTAVASADLLDRLEKEGLLAAPLAPDRESAAGHERARPARPEGVTGLVRRLRR